MKRTQQEKKIENNVNATRIKMKKQEKKSK